MNEYLGKIKQAYDLCRMTDKAASHVDTVENERYPQSRPREPRRQVAEYVPPERPKSSLKYPWKHKMTVFLAMFVLSLVLVVIGNATSSLLIACVVFIVTAVDWIYLVAVLVDRAVKFPKKVDADVNRLMQTPEYLAKVDAQKQVQEELQEQYDAKYQKLLSKYNIDLAEYKKAYNAFEADRKQRLVEAKAALAEYEGKFRSACDEIGELPYKYRNTEALAYIHGVIESSSSMTVKEAIESYDRHVQQEIDRQRLEEERYQSKLAEQRLAEAERAADAQEEYNNIAERAARHQDMWNAVGAMQRHNTNKHLKNMSQSTSSTSRHIDNQYAHDLMSKPRYSGDKRRPGKYQRRI